MLFLSLLLLITHIIITLITIAGIANRDKNLYTSSKKNMIPSIYNIKHYLPILKPSVPRKISPVTPNTKNKRICDFNLKKLILFKD